jgi:mannose-6-phosphate isomerase
MSALYPLKFKTIFKDKIWGGHKIETYLHKNIGDLPNCGETWEISGVKSDVSVVDERRVAGPVAGRPAGEIPGRIGGREGVQSLWQHFPFTGKFIDANDDLSVQVHPNDDWLKNAITRSVKPKCGM